MSRENSNFLADILAAAEGEEILSVKFPGNVDPYGYGTEAARFAPLKQYAGKLALFSEVKELFNFSYYTGYGSMDCPDIVFWTETKVLYIHEYDGSTTIHSQYRNPT